MSRDQRLPLTWSASEIRALRRASRLSAESLAAALGASVRTVAYWEAGRVRPGSTYQAALDTLLQRLDDDARERFERLMSPTGGDRGSTRREVLCACGAALVSTICTVCGAGAGMLDALAVVCEPEGADTTSGIEALEAVAGHYAWAMAGARPERAHRDLTAARHGARSLLAHADRNPARRRRLQACTARLSLLLAMTATHDGATAESLVWCTDARHHAQSARDAELAAWADHTASVACWYEGDATAAAAHASRGLVGAPHAGAARARSASQQMRALATLHRVDDAEVARRAAQEALEAYQAECAGGDLGVFAGPSGDVAPYTATSLLLLDRPVEALPPAQQVADGIDPQVRSPRRARALLIAALAQTGAGASDAAAASGLQALAAADAAWPTLVLAGRLERSLRATTPTARDTVAFSTEYRAAALALQAGRRTS